MREKSLPGSLSCNSDSESHPCELECVSEDIEVPGSEDKQDN